MTLVGPPPPRAKTPVQLITEDVRAERKAGATYPPGYTSWRFPMGQAMLHKPLPTLLEAYERFGPVFTLRFPTTLSVFMIGAEANHYITVSHAQNFHWRESHFRELIFFVGDGLMTIDGDFHRRSRQIMLPAFHRERIAGYVDEMRDEVGIALEGLSPGMSLDLYAWARDLALRIAMRTLFGLDPDGSAVREADVARMFERALAYYCSGFPVRFMRGPGTPLARMKSARRTLDKLVFGEIAERRKSGRRGTDMLSLLLDGEDEAGNKMTDQQVRDEVMALLFAGHDSVTSTIAFMFFELSRQPAIEARLIAEQDATFGGPALSDSALTIEQLNGSGLPELEMTIEETLRKYPPPWLGPRRSVEEFEFDGHVIPANAHVNYSMWATHHLPELYPEPQEFRPERFTPEAKAARPKGAYVPFGGGPRTCIGMRFAQITLRLVATMMLARLHVDVADDFELRTRQMPTIGPKDGLPVTLRARMDRSSPAAETSLSPA